MPPSPPPVPSFPDSRPKPQTRCLCPSCLAQGVVRLLAASASNHQGVDRAGHPRCGAWSREDGRFHRGNGSCSPIYSYGLPNGTEIVDNLASRNASCHELPENVDMLRHKTGVSRKTKLPPTDSFNEPDK